jgi:NADH-quinone oxidoreductase subunit M
MNFLQLPWLELAFVFSLLGALWVSQIREPYRAARYGLVFTGAVFGCAMVAWLAFAVGAPREADNPSLQMRLFNRTLFEVDAFNAPLIPGVALLHFLTALATARTKMRRFSFSWSLAAESIRLATFSTSDPTMIVFLLVISTVPPYVELVNREKPRRVFVLHMAIFVGLLVLGWGLLQAGTQFTTAAVVLLAAAILVRSGTFPMHCWVTDWFEHASFGNALLFLTPLSGVYAAVRLVVPIAPEWVLEAIGFISLFTAVYAAGMATVQRETRRFFAYFFLSNAAMVLVGIGLIGLELHSTKSLTAAFCLWFSVILSIAGFGLILRSLEARFGRITLVSHHGLYEQVPMLAICFMVLGLACVGFPFTLGFISTELLVDGAIEANLYVGMAVIAAAALNGIAVVRAYILIFTGARHRATVSLQTGLRERIAVWTLSALILGGGLFPQPGIHSRHEAAEAVLHERQKNFPELHPEALHGPPADGPEDLQIASRQ